MPCGSEKSRPGRSGVANLEALRRTLHLHRRVPSLVVCSAEAASVSSPPSCFAARVRSALGMADGLDLGHALRRNTAGAFGPDLAKKLAQLVKMEKNVMRSLEMVAKERMDVAV